MIVTLAAWLLPPGPEQVSAYVASSPSAPVLRLPLVARVPLQLPDAVHEVALADDHVKIAEPPASIVVLEASRDTVGSAVTGEEPPPQPESSETAPSMNEARQINEAVRRMEFRGSFLSTHRNGSLHRDAINRPRRTAKIMSHAALEPRPRPWIRLRSRIRLRPGPRRSGVPPTFPSRDEGHTLHNVRETHIQERPETVPENASSKQRI